MVLSRRGRAGLVTLLALGLGTCGRPAAEPGRVVIDLVASFALAEVHPTTTFVDLGSPAARPHQIRGWAHPTLTLPGGGEGSWSMGDSAELGFFVARIEDLEMAFLVAPVEPEADLSLSVNGSPLWAQPLTPAYLEYQVTIPAALLKLGENRLEIRHSPLSFPHQPKKDVRVVWDYVRFGPARAEPEPPRVDRDAGTLFIPFGARVDFYPDLPPSSTFTADALKVRGRGGLRVSWHPLEASRPASSAELRRGSDRRATLTSTTGARGRLSLFALADGEDGSGPSGVRLTRPRVVTLAPPAAPATATAPAVAASRPNVILYMIDTLRADHLGCYGYPRDTSPFIDRFAEGAVLFENAQAQTPWTRASVASVLTGLWSQAHMALGDLDALSEEAVTLPERLREAGYRTAAVIANGNVNQYAGFAQGFDDFIYLQNVRPDQLLARSDDVNDAVFAWLDEHSGEGPFFLWILTIDPHLPYQAPEPFHSRFSAAPRDPSLGTAHRIGQLEIRNELIPRETIDHLVDLYDAEIAANDAGFGAFVDDLERRRIYEESLLVVVADHGEELYDHSGWDHGSTLHSEVLDVPLILKLPHGSGPVRRRELVQQVDLVPTILELVGAPPLARTQGTSLVPLLAGASDVEWHRRAVSHVNLRGTVATSIVDGEWKAILPHYSGSDAYPLLFHRAADRAEQEDLAPERSDLARYLVSTLKSQLQRSGIEPLQRASLDPEAVEKSRQQLKALGYLD